MAFHSRTSCIATLLANGPEFAPPLYLNARPKTVQVPQFTAKEGLITQHIAAFEGENSFCRGTARRAFFCMATFRPLNFSKCVSGAERITNLELRWECWGLAPFTEFEPFRIRRMVPVPKADVTIKNNIISGF
jgi:hypothetical protein